MILSRLVIGVCGAVVLGYGWLGAASFAYCALVGRPDAFVAPWTQWLDVLPWWGVNWFMTVAVVVSAVAPLLPFVAVVVLVLRRPGMALYGKSSWAT